MININNFTKYILLICASLSMLCTAVISPVLPMMRDEFINIPNINSILKIIATLPNLLIAISAPFFGLAMHKIKNIQLFLVIMFLICGASGSLCYFQTNIYYIGIMMTLVGISIGGIMTCGIYVLSSRMTQEERNKTLPMQTTIMSMGSIIFTILSGIVSDFQWNITFLLYGYCFIITVLLFFTKISDKTIEHNESSSIENIGYFGKKLGNRLPILICFIAMLNMVFFYMIPIQIPFLLKTINENITGKMISYVITIEVVASAFFATRYKKVRKNRSFESMFLFAFSIMSVSYFMISYCSSYWSVLFWCGIYGIGMAFMMPNNIIWIVNSVSDQYRGFWIGCISFSTYLGKFLSPVLMSLVIKKIGLFGTYRMSSILMFVIATMVLFFADGMKHDINKIKKKFSNH